MTESKIYQLMDLVEDIKQLDEMIQLHSKNEDDNTMLTQYQAKKIKLLSSFIEELNTPTETSLNSLVIIKKLLEKFISENNNTSKISEPLQLGNLSKLAAVI